MAARIGGLPAVVKSYIDAAVAALTKSVASAVRYDAAQSLTAQQAAQARNNVGSQAALGFIPVAQGTGADQNPNFSVQIGLGVSVNKLKASIGNGDFGSIWTDRDCTFNQNQNAGYHKSPSGLILQWMLVNGGADTAVTFPVAFPTAVFNLQGTSLNDGTQTGLHSADFKSVSKSGATVMPRYASGGTTGTSATQTWVLAIGV